MTGFSAAVRALVDNRSQFTCEICGLYNAVEYHHRRPRNSGGTRRPETNEASNAVAACRACHRLAEQHRDVARLCGWLVPQSGDPSTVPIMRRGELVFLDDDGGMRCAN